MYVIRFSVNFRISKQCDMLNEVLQIKNNQLSFYSAFICIASNIYEQKYN